MGEKRRARSAEGKLARVRFLQESALVYVSQPDTVMDACKHSWTPVSCLRKFGSFKFPTSPGKDGWLFFFVKCHLCRDSLKTQPPVPPLNLSQTQVVSVCAAPHSLSAVIEKVDWARKGISI